MRMPFGPPWLAERSRVARAFGRRAGTAFVAVAMCSIVANAHPVHTTYSVVKPDGNGFTLTIRTFADDFSASVAHHAGKRAPADSSASDADVLRYVTARVVVTTPNGGTAPLQLCGVRREREVYWVCVRTLAKLGNGMRLQNQLLTDRHADQVNIVQVEAGGVRSTRLFTKDSGPTELTR